MRGLARRFEQDEDLWGLTGLFHDLDQDHTGDDAANHARLAAEWLREAAVDERVINGVLAHAYEEYRTDLMSKAVVHADAVAGLLVAAALVRPERSAGMKVSSVKKKLKEKAFAPGVNRDEVTGVEASIGLPLDEFLVGLDRGAAARGPRDRSVAGPCSRRWGGRSSAPRRCSWVRSSRSRSRSPGRCWGSSWRSGRAC